MPFFISDGLRFEYTTRGSGVNTFFFQHGIGGTHAQPLRFLHPPGSAASSTGTPQTFSYHLRLATFDFRAHGRTPVGDPQKLRLDVFADDLLTFMDFLEVEKAVLGGISMGAAVALNAASRYPDRCTALVLCRPAWLNGSMCPTAVAAYQEVVKCLKEDSSPEAASQKLQRSDIYRVVAKQSADAARSLLGQLRCVISDPSMQTAVRARLRFLPSGQPGQNLQCAARLNMPTLVLATPDDPIHPLAYARQIATAIPDSSYVELAPKQLDDSLHIQEVNSYLYRFLSHRLSNRSNL